MKILDFGFWILDFGFWILGSMMNIACIINVVYVVFNVKCLAN
jgi:hypothetical protein